MRLDLDLSPDQFLVFEMLATASVDALDCQQNKVCDGSVSVDPLISFDQTRFDALAAAQGVPSVPLDEFFTFKTSPQFDLLPPIPSDSPAAVAEPSALALLLAGLGWFVAARRLQFRGHFR